MGRKKLNIFKRILIFYKYINGKEIKEIRGIDCEYCKSQDLKILEKGESIDYETLIKFNIRYICKNCGTVIDEVQTHRKPKD